MSLYIVHAKGNDGMTDSILLESGDDASACDAVIEGLQEDRPGVTVTVLSCKRVSRRQAEQTYVDRVWC